MSSPTATIEPARPSDWLGRSLHCLCRNRYRYKSCGDNALAPVASADSFPLLLEAQDFAWISRFILGTARAHGNLLLKRIRFAAQTAVKSFDLLRAYERLFSGVLPDFVASSDRDEAFAYRRIAGPNALEIRRVVDLDALLAKIPLCSARLDRATGRPVDLAGAVRESRLFVVDFTRIQAALRPSARPPRTRDSRWRRKYLPAPIAVFLEDPESQRRVQLLPLAIQIDQPQPNGEPNPIYYCDDGTEWKLAKLYFEVADHNSHFGCGHLYRSHFAMEPFCLATSRALDFEHPIHLLLRPHTRYTLATNRAAYRNFVDRKQIYFDFYAGTLDESRQILIESYWEKTFAELELEAELRSRGVWGHLVDYPYRDDGVLWREAIRGFVGDYVRVFYSGDAAVVDDFQLQAWAEELMDPYRAAVRGLLSDNRLDTVAKLIDLLAQVLFIAGPGHASQHFTEMHYYRYSAAFPAAAYAPPSWKAGRANAARFRNTLPPIQPASWQFTYSTFGDFRFDRFGDYSDYPLGRVREAQSAIRGLHAALRRVQEQIERRLATRLLRYDFLLPSLVPNSINI
jgi:arachidonate 15-lipoxygenase